MNAKRLLRLADYLETVVAFQPESFDMDFWAKKAACGTVCCALGHACSIPEFQAAGLRLSWDHTTGTAEVALDGFDPEDGFSVAEEFFGLDGEQSSRIFSAPRQSHLTPIDVANRIRALVAEQAQAEAK